MQSECLPFIICTQTQIDLLLCTNTLLGDKYTRTRVFYDSLQPKQFFPSRLYSGQCFLFTIPGLCAQIGLTSLGCFLLDYVLIGTLCPASAFFLLSTLKITLYAVGQRSCSADFAANLCFTCVQAEPCPDQPVERTTSRAELVLPSLPEVAAKAGQRERGCQVWSFPGQNKQVWPFFKTWLASKFL